MRLFLAGIIAAAAGMVAVPAAAWWDYARWAMSPAELAAASGNRLQPCAQNVETCEIRLLGFKPSHYVRGLTVSGLTADALFSFDAGGKLTHTVLRFGGDGRNARYLQGVLAKRYGPPLDVKKDWLPHVLWRDQTAGTTINLIDLSPSYVLVDYQPF